MNLAEKSQMKGSEKNTANLKLYEHKKLQMGKSFKNNNYNITFSGFPIKIINNILVLQILEIIILVL